MKNIIDKKIEKFDEFWMKTIGSGATQHEIYLFDFIKPLVKEFIKQSLEESIREFKEKILEDLKGK
jgi:hypothetical protein